jgi:hypothetical protein
MIRFADSRIVVSVAILGLAFVVVGVYKIRAALQRRRARALLLTRLATIKPEFRFDREIQLGRSPGAAESAFRKGDSFEEGLAALDEHRFEVAIELFTRAIGKIPEACNYRAIAHY